MKSELVLVNDDDSFHGSTSPSRRRITSSAAGRMRYYSFMHRTMETPGRTTASSSFFASANGKSCIMVIRSAVALSNFLKGYEQCCSTKNDGQ